ncbi:MAG: branched-chain amino acid transport system II carrier protein [Eubacteriales bacterium]|nr:branched-chain amino acid transport system II carrier protein [Eubacteriales bacterium]
MSKKFKDVLAAALTLFTMFLGAGNIMFPPFVGVHAGNGWLVAALGFVIMGAGLPLMGSLAVAHAGGDSNNMFEGTWKWLALSFHIMVIVIIGPLFAIPRTAATMAEMSVLPFMPESINRDWVFFGASAVFFIITYLLSASESSVLDTIGGKISPVLVLFLLISVIISIVKPIGTPTPRDTSENLFYFGVSSGYQTMDGLASIVLSGAVGSLLLKKGYNEQESRKMLSFCAVFAGLMLGFVYIGYCWIGASTGDALTHLNTHTAVLSEVSYMLSGQIGKIMFALIILFACLTTSSGLVVTFAQYFEKLFKNRLSYKAWARIGVLISFLISLIGTKSIISISAPILEALYPLCVVLIVLNLLKNKIPSAAAFRGGIIAAGLFSILQLSCNIPFVGEFSKQIVAWLPLGKEGFGYVLPSLLGVFIGTIEGKRIGQKEKSFR